MAYCTIEQVNVILAQTITSANTRETSGSKMKLSQIAGGSVSSPEDRRPVNLISASDGEYFIGLACSEVDAALSAQYRTPVNPRTDFETSLSLNSSAGSNQITLLNVGNLLAGDRIQVYTNDFEEFTISSISGKTLTLSGNLSANTVTGSRFLRIQFPDPIPFIAARLAAAGLYDRLLMAQSSPGKSEYGELVRNQALQDLNNIREGRTVLHGIQRIGHRFANPTLFDRYSSRALYENDSTRTDPGPGR